MNWADHDWGTRASYMLAAATLLQAELMDYDLEEKAQTVVALAQRLSEVANEP